MGSHGPPSSSGGSHATGGGGHPTATDLQFSLLPLAHSGHGAVTSLVSWRQTVYAGTASGTLLQYDLDLFEDDSLPAPTPVAPHADRHRRASKLRPALEAAGPFSVVRVHLASVLDARKHHKLKVPTSGTGPPAPITDLQLCPALGVVFALCEGVLCAYDLKGLRFQARVSPPVSAPIDRFAIFPPATPGLANPSLSPMSASFSPTSGGIGGGGGGGSGGAFAFISICVCVGKKLFVLARNTPDTDAAPPTLTNKMKKKQHQSPTPTSSSSTATTSNSAWSVRQELFLPEAAHCLAWIDAVHVLVGFRREYTVLNSVTGDVLDLCGVTPGSGETLLHRLAAERTLLHTGSKALLHYCDNDSHVLADAMTYASPPRAIGTTALFALTLHEAYVHLYLRPSGSGAWRVVQNIAVSGASILWSDGGPLVLLAKGPQLYFFQPMLATDKQRDAVAMIHVKNNYFTAQPTAAAAPTPPPPAATSPTSSATNHTSTSTAAATTATTTTPSAVTNPNVQVWTREEALKSLTSHVNLVLNERTHPFSLMIRCFDRYLKREIHRMMTIEQQQQQQQQQQQAQSHSTTHQPEPMSPDSSASASSPSSMSSLTIGDLATNSSFEAAPPRSSASSVSPAAAPTLNADHRRVLVDAVHEFRHMAAISMRIMWSDVCSPPPPPSSKPSKSSSSSSLLSASSFSNHSTDIPTTSEPPKTDFLAECTALFDGALFRRISRRLLPLYIVASAEEDARCVEACTAFAEQRVNMEYFGSALLRKSPWLHNAPSTTTVAKASSEAEPGVSVSSNERPRTTPLLKASASFHPLGPLRDDPTPTPPAASTPVYAGAQWTTPPALSSTLAISSLLLDAYAPSIALLKTLSQQVEPASKLRLLGRVHQQVVVDSQKVHDPSGIKPFTMSADELVPILCFVIVQAKPSRLFAETEFIMNFLDAEAALGVDGYIVTTMQIALSQLIGGGGGSLGSATHSPSGPSGAMPPSPLLASLTDSTMSPIFFSPLAAPLPHLHTGLEEDKHETTEMKSPTNIVSPTSTTPLANPKPHRISQHFMPLASPIIGSPATGGIGSSSTPAAAATTTTTTFTFGSSAAGPAASLTSCPASPSTSRLTDADRFAASSSPALVRTNSNGIGLALARGGDTAATSLPRTGGIGSALLAASNANVANTAATAAATTAAGAVTVAAPPQAALLPMPALPAPPASRSPSASTTTSSSSPSPSASPSSRDSWHVERDPGGRRVLSMELRPMSSSPRVEPTEAPTNAIPPTPTNATTTPASATAIGTTVPSSAAAAATANRLGLLSNAHVLMAAQNAIRQASTPR